MDQRQIVQRALESEHITLYVFELIKILNIPKEQVTEDDIHQFIHIIALQQYYPNPHNMLWIKILLSVTDQTLLENGHPPSRGTSSQLSSIITPVGAYNIRFEIFEIEEIKETLGVFEDDLKNYHTIKWDTRPFPNTELSLNEADFSRLLSSLIENVISLVKKMNLIVSLESQAPINGQKNNQRPASQEFNRVLRVRPDFLLRGEVGGISVSIPIEMKTNIKKIVDEIQTKGKIEEPSSLSILQQITGYLIQAKSSMGILSDYSRTVVIKIDFDKTLSKEQDHDIIDHLHFQYIIVQNDGAPFTLRKMILWVIYHTFKISTVDEINGERSKLRLFARLLVRDPENVRQEERRLSTELRNELSRSDEVVELVDADIEMEVIARSKYYTTIMIPFHKYKLYFNQNVRDRNIEKVSIKIWNPQGTRFNHPAIVDDEKIEEMGNLHHRTSLFNSLIARETNSLLRIDRYNDSQTNISLKMNAPKVLGSGSISIYDRYGLIQHIGLYIATSYIEQTRQFELNDFTNLENQTQILNEEVGLAHMKNLTLDDIIISNENVYLTGYEMTDTIDNVRFRARNIRLEDYRDMIERRRRRV